MNPPRGHASSYAEFEVLAAGLLLPVISIT